MSLFFAQRGLYTRSADAINRVPTLPCAKALFARTSDTELKGFSPRKGTDQLQLVREWEDCKKSDKHTAQLLISNQTTQGIDNQKAI